MSGPSAKVIAPRVKAIREFAAQLGRNPAEILMFSMFTVILGETEAEARAKYEDYRRHISPEGALTLMSGWTGVDFSTYALDQQVRHVTNDAGRSAMDNITRADPDRVWTVREVAEHVGIGGIGPVIVGTPVSASTLAISSSSARLRAVGFSTRAGTPARMAAMASAACVWGGVQMWTRSTSPVARRSSALP